MVSWQVIPRKNWRIETWKRMHGAAKPVKFGDAASPKIGDGLFRAVGH
jgi:hypothetical protein